MFGEALRVGKILADGDPDFFWPFTVVLLLHVEDGAPVVRPEQYSEEGLG